MDDACRVCGKKKEIISRELGVCLDCIRHRFSEAKPFIDKAHRRVREELKLPLQPPKDKGGIPCGICINQCIIGNNKTGYCGIRKNQGGKLVDFGGATLNWYYESLPANCVADFCCSGCKEQKKAEKNLAVFYGACSFNCLFCQNWHFRDHLTQPNVISAEELASKADDKTSCISFFGGDPTPQIRHAIDTAKRILERKKDQIFRVCFETNGCMNRELLLEIAELALKSGGTIKFDLKAFNENLHYALTGVSNKWTLENFKLIGNMAKQRKEPPLLIASTPLVTGYIDDKEVSDIAHFIAIIDKNIPYCLLAFYPQFYMYDLPPTKLKYANSCLKAAKAAGLKYVTLGNQHLLR